LEVKLFIWGALKALIFEKKKVNQNAHYEKTH
jgi:hypothetical protein